MFQIPLRKLDEVKPRPADLGRFEAATTDELRAWQRDRCCGRYGTPAKTFRTITTGLSIFDPDGIDCSPARHDALSITDQGSRLR